MSTKPILSVPDPKLLGPFRNAHTHPAFDNTVMSGVRRLVQTLELVISGDTIEGRIRPESGPSRDFSGWSELFAQLQSLTSEPSRDADANEQDAKTVNAASQTMHDSGPPAVPRNQHQT